MKKSTTKKAQARSKTKPKPAKKTSIAARNKKKPTQKRTSPLASSRKSSVGTKKTLATTSSGGRPVRAGSAIGRAQNISTDGKVEKVDRRGNRKSAASPRPAEQAYTKPEPPPPPPPPPVKTYLTARELKEFKELLLAKRAELAGDVERLTSEALNRKSGGVNEQSSMPIHMADLGSDTWEQDFTLGLLANEQNLVREIDAALARIEDKTYGICMATDKPISKERLRAKPWAKFCIEYARLREEGRAP